MPAALRPHVAAVYAFARGADDIADEPGRSSAERLALLDEWSAHLRQAPQSAVFEALDDTRRRFDLPLELFDDLLSAFKQDVKKTRYDSWEEVFDYCRRSANPVGRLVLRLAGVRRHDADAWSDDICTALQLTNFWQDLAIDWQRGRLYIPRSAWAAAGAETGDLDREVISSAWQRTLHECVVGHRRPVSTRPSGLRRSARSVALRAAGDVARRHAGAAEDQGRPIRRVPPSPDRGRR